MTDDEIREEIARQVRDVLETLAAGLRDRAQHHGPVIAKALVETAEEIERLPRR